MKKVNYLSLLCLLLVTQLLFAQKITSAKVIYAIQKVLPPDYMEKTDKIFDPDSREFLVNTYHMTSKVNGILIFKNNKALYQVSEKDIDKQKELRRTQKGVNFSLSLGGSENVYYTDLVKNELFYKGKTMSMEDQLVYYKKAKWELLDEKKTILGYVCKKAKLITKKEKKKEVFAWYTEAIPVSVGPKNYLGLPGLILEVAHGNDTFIATSIDVNPKKLKIKKPTAKLITTLEKKLKAYEKLMDENE